MTDEEQLDYLLCYDYSITLTRIIDNTFYPSTIDLSIDYELLNNENLEESFVLVNEWIEHINYSLCLDYAVCDKITFEPKNNIITCPQDPTDDVLCALLHSKISTLLEPAASIISMKYKSSTSNGLRIEWIGSTKHILPQDNTYVATNAWTKPWWLRQDLLSIDLPHNKEIPKSCIIIKETNETTVSNNQAEIIKPFFPKVIKNDEI